MKMRQPILRASAAASMVIAMSGGVASAASTPTTERAPVARSGVDTGPLTVLSSTPSGQSARPGVYGLSDVSRNGRWLLFTADASSLPRGGGATELYAKNRVTGALRVVTSDAAGVATSSEGGDYEHRNGLISPDNEHAVFWTAAGDLVPGVDGDHAQVYLKNLRTGAISVVSSASDGTPGDGDSSFPQSAAGLSAASVFSADGRFTVFRSTAGNLAPHTPSDFCGIYRKDLATGAVIRVAGRSIYEPTDCLYNEVAISPDAGSIAYTLHDRVTGYPSLYLKDLRTGRVRTVVRQQPGVYVQQLQFTPDGSSLLFDSGPFDERKHYTPLIYRYQTSTHRRTVVSQDADGHRLKLFGPAFYYGLYGSRTLRSMSADGTMVAFSSRTGKHKTLEVYVKNLATGRLTLASSDVDGIAARGAFPGGTLPGQTSFAFSPDDNWVAFNSNARNLVRATGLDVHDLYTYVKNLRTGQIRLVSARPDGTLLHADAGLAFAGGSTLVLAAVDEQFNTQAYAKTFR